MDKYNYNMGISKEESNIISVIRVVAMFLIVGCHYANVFEQIAFVGQILNVGVHVFFIVSGFIYGQKEIKNTGEWIKNRFIRILVPVYSFYLIAFILLCFWGKIGELSLTAILFQILNLNGFIDNAGIGNIFTGHLWYISFILICYMITPFLQKVRGKMSWKSIACFLIAASVLEIIFICNIKVQAFTSCIPGIFTYISAYFFGAYWRKKIKRNRYLSLSIFMIICMLVRLYVQGIADINSVYELFYGRVVVQYTHTVLAYWIFITLYGMCLNYSNLVQNVKGFISFFDSISFEIYITHQVLCAGVLSVMELTDSVIANTIIFITLTLIMAIILNRISKVIVLILNGRIKNWRVNSE